MLTPRTCASGIGFLPWPALRRDLILKLLYHTTVAHHNLICVTRRATAFSDKSDPSAACERSHVRCVSKSRTNIISCVLSLCVKKLLPTKKVSFFVWHITCVASSYKMLLRL